MEIEKISITDFLKVKNKLVSEHAMITLNDDDILTVLANSSGMMYVDAGGKDESVDEFLGRCFTELKGTPQVMASTSVIVSIHFSPSDDMTMGHMSYLEDFFDCFDREKVHMLWGLSVDKTMTVTAVCTRENLSYRIETNIKKLIKAVKNFMSEAWSDDY